MSPQEMPCGNFSKRYNSFYMDEVNTMAAGGLGADNPTPKEVYEQMERYLKETENLITLLKDSLSKGEDQLNTLTTFDSRAPQLSPTITPIDTTTLRAEIEEVRKRIVSLEELRDRVKSDIEKVKAIGEKIAGIIGQYRSGL